MLMMGEDFCPLYTHMEIMMIPAKVIIESAFIHDLCSLYFEAIN
jgi:hypothetical protein